MRCVYCDSALQLMTSMVQLSTLSNSIFFVIIRVPRDFCLHRTAVICYSKICGNVIFQIKKCSVDLPWLLRSSSLGHEYEFSLKRHLDEAGLAYLGEISHFLIYFLDKLIDTLIYLMPFKVNWLSCPFHWGGHQFWWWLAYSNDLKDYNATSQTSIMTYSPCW